MSEIAAVKKQKFSVKELCYIGLFAVVIMICSWISLNIGPVPFTLQTFGVFCTLGILGGKRGLFSVITYILLGAVGIPVFAGFSGGIGVLFGTTGGYIIGFIFSALVYWLITAKIKNNLLFRIIGMIAGLIVCYAFGTVWFIIFYTKGGEAIDLATALSWCVTPFIIPDCVKIALAVLISERVRKYAKLD